MDIWQRANCKRLGLVANESGLFLLLPVMVIDCRFVTILIFGPNLQAPQSRRFVPNNRPVVCQDGSTSTYCTQPSLYMPSVAYHIDTAFPSSSTTISSDFSPGISDPSAPQGPGTRQCLWIAYLLCKYYPS
jgi:hypothetical protein